MVSTPLDIKHYILLPQIVQSQTTTDISHCFQILQYLVNRFYLCISNTYMRISHHTQVDCCSVHFCISTLLQRSTVPRFISTCGETDWHYSIVSIIVNELNSDDYILNNIHSASWWCDFDIWIILDKYQWAQHWWWHSEWSFGNIKILK